MFLIICLFKFNELVPLFSDFIVMAVAHIQQFIFNRFILFQYIVIYVLSEFFFAICLTDLMRRIFHEPIFCRVNKYVPWLLKSYGMMTVCMVYLIYSLFIDKFMSCKKLWLFRIFIDANFNEQVFHPIWTFNLIDIELCFQSMIHLIVLSKEIVDDLNNWIVVCECRWIWLDTQFIWNKHLLSLFKFQYE